MNVLLRHAWRPVVAAGVAGLAARDGLVALGVLLLVVAWMTLWRRAGIPVLAFAFTFQWLQVMIGVLYHDFTGRTPNEMRECDWEPMVVVGLGALVTLLAGILLGERILRRQTPRELAPSSGDMLARLLPAAYLTLTITAGILHNVGVTYGAITQIVVAIIMARLGMVFLLYRRLLAPPARTAPVIALLLFEVGLGFTGYFASFREAFVIFLIAVIERFDHRRAAHWLALGSVGVLSISAALVWTGIKLKYRTAWRDSAFADASASTHLDRIATLSESWLDSGANAILRDADKLVSRVWCIHYQALALTRVPAIVPHENGKLFGAAIAHVLTPRLLYPEKEQVASDSHKVRRYAGVWVAAESSNTTIAFGYVGESYVDFGLPLMFLPILLYGILVGLGHRHLSRMIRDRELHAGASAAIFWNAVYLYERSWIHLLGVGVSIYIVIGGATTVLDRLLTWFRLQRPERSLKA